MKNEHDPKNLIADAYEMRDLGVPEARSIFLDWALNVADSHASIPVLLAQYGDRDHPMTAVLQEGLGKATPKRRGGRAARIQ